MRSCAGFFVSLDGAPIISDKGDHCVDRFDRLCVASDRIHELRASLVGLTVGELLLDVLELTALDTG